MPQIDEVIGFAATNIAKAINADGIVSIEKIPQEDIEDKLKIKVTIFKKNDKKYEKSEYITSLRQLNPGSVVPIKDILIEAINKNYIQKKEKIVCVEDGSISSGYKGMLFIFDVDDIFYKISKQNISENISPSIIESIIDISLEISKEGREGKKIGTAFIIGESSEISKYLKQLIINPFQTLDKKIKITDTSIKETVKEFSQLDGVFVIDQEGNIISSGTYIDIDTSNLDSSYSGFGTKHRSCLALTKETNAIAIVVSESGGSIRILKKGKVVLKI